MMSIRTTAAATALAATLGSALVCWIVVISLMSEMDMGIAARVGSFASFMIMWTLMMAAMMLPGLAPVVLSHIQEGWRVSKVSVFIGSYLVIWALAGVPFYAVYQPHGTFVAGAITVAAGLYELTSLKQFFRRSCREKACSGFECGLSCLGSCIGLMLVQVTLGFMSMTWMSVITVLVFAQKVLPAKAVMDIPLALTIIGLGILIVIAPSHVPGMMPGMGMRLGGL